MTRLWPKDSGTDLNNEVAYLFFSTRNKLSNNLVNCTNHNLYIDLLNIYGKRILLQTCLYELEILILDIVELNLDPQNIQLLVYKISCDLINKSQKRFLLNIAPGSNHLKSFIHEHNFTVDSYINLIISEYKILLYNLLIYIIFGSSAIQDSSIAFTYESIPSCYVSILLETFLVQFGNLVIYVILDNFSTLFDIHYFLSTFKLCNKSYLSIRSLAYFKNSLSYQKLIYLYIQYPQLVYNCRSRVLLISSYGIISKYIYSTRFQEMLNLSSLQLFIVFLIELQDLVVPKLESVFLMLGKIVLYIFINLFANSFIIIVKMVVARFYSKKLE